MINHTKPPETAIAVAAAVERACASADLEALERLFDIYCHVSGNERDRAAARIRSNHLYFRLILPRPAPEDDGPSDTPDLSAAA